MQYRAELLIWLIGMILSPVVYLVVWSTVSKAQGGSVAGYSSGDFAAYFLVTMMVNFVTFDWHMWDYEYRVREGGFSPLLLKPIHPIHNDLAENLTYKTITSIVMLPAAIVLGIVFNASIHPTSQQILLFIPTLLLAFILRWFVEWTFALAAFWTTRTLAVNRVYLALSLFLAGRMSPLKLLPEPLRIAADWLPFKWMIAFPTEVLLGRVETNDALQGMLWQCLWSVVAFVIMVVVWKRAVRRYAGVGA
jgi:ABC-2 type transport system permease protein